MSPRIKFVMTTQPSLGRAEVLSVVDADTVFVRFHRAPAEEIVRATVAVPQYLPCCGDRVLVSELDGEIVILGVFGEARRRAEPGAICEGLVARRRSDGVVELRATEGALVVAASGGIQIEAPELFMRAERVETVADRIVERSQSSYRHTDDLTQTTAGRARIIVDETCELQARRTVIASDDDTVIDGKRVLLG